MALRTALIIGGNRFFGRHLAISLLKAGTEVTLLTRGRLDDGLGNQVKRLTADRTRKDELESVLAPGSWDVVFDQVGFTATDATTLCECLKGKTGRVIFTSSQSVYGMGEDLDESRFDPSSFSFEKEVTAAEDYAEAKRQAEWAYAKFPDLKPVMARMPLVIGIDDYTGRLKWHLDRCRKEEPVYFPNLDAQLGFVRSDFAGEILHRLAESSHLGPINTACPGVIGLREFVALIELNIGRKFVLDREPTAENRSPYGVPQTWTMSLRRLDQLGIQMPALHQWLPELLQEPVL